jgi:TolB-like protein/class 3 adenylate cyclase/tetratricopeptide (TPR) repeat protein
MMASPRRLAAILAADVAGYSRLMGIDEDGTHRAYTAHLRELVTPKIQEHRGRIVKSTGDGLLAEFASVVGAVQCAVEVQYGMGIRNDPVDEDRRVVFRIGINVSDVITESGELFGDGVPGDIYGDGVNIAARLESLAEPNGICVSQAVHDQIRDKLPYRFEDLGRQAVKNIARPLHAFALRAETIAALAISNWKPIPSLPEPAILGLPQQRAPRLSIVVLPFTNLSDDREQQYFADAVTDDVTTDLSRISDMVVISRNTAFTYKDRPIDTRQIGRDLNVRYLLGGSVRRAGNRLRVNTHLIDAETDAHVWAERFDHDSGDLFALQDEVTSKIAVALNLEMTSAEAARPTERPVAFDYVLQGRAKLYNYKGLTRERFVEAIELFERALTVNPASIEARVLLALALIGRVFEQATETPAADIARTEALIKEVVAVSPRHPRANLIKGQLLRAHHQYEQAIPEYEAAIALDRNSVQAIAALGLCRFFTGDLEEAIPAQEHAIRLSPRDTLLPNWYWRIGMVHLLQSRTDAAIPWLERARNANPQLAGPRAWLVSAYALKSDMAAAAAELAEARRLSGDNRYDTIASHKVAQQFNVPSIVALFEDTFFAGLRKAGVPDE